MKPSFLEKKKVLILGLGREGMATFLFLRRLLPQKVLGLADQLEYQELTPKCKRLIEKDKKIRLYLGKTYLKSLDKYDIVIKSPGIPIHLPEIERAQKLKKITSATEIFFENCLGTIVGITGTKGKSTTTSLIYKILKAAKFKVHLVGNIGRPVLSLFSSFYKKDHIFVYELSSHQLFNLKKSPHIAVLLNIYREHLDYYKSFEEYIKAKENITRWQNPRDYLIFNSKDKIVKEIAKNSKAKKIPIPDVSQIKIKTGLIGKLNPEGVMAAIAVGRIFHLSFKKMEEVIEKFKPLPCRLEFIGQFKGIRFYNDSLSTIPESTIKAIKILEEDVETLILGGFDRNQNFKQLSKEILKSKIKNLILFPTTGKRIWQDILYENRVLTHKGQSQRLPKHFFVENMKEAVKLSFENTSKGKICLLSPASPSFGIFKDYRERGNLFKKWVRRYGASK